MYKYIYTGDTNMINIETNIIRLDTWEVDMAILLGFDTSLFTTEPIPVEDRLNNTYSSYVKYLVAKYKSDSTPVYNIITSILEDIAELYEARDITISYLVEPTVVDAYIAVIAYQK